MLLTSCLSTRLHRTKSGQNAQLCNGRINKCEKQREAQNWVFDQCVQAVKAQLSSQVYEPGIAPGEVVRDVPASDLWVNHTILKYLNVGQIP